MCDDERELTAARASSTTIRASSLLRRRCTFRRRRLWPSLEVGYLDLSCADLQWRRKLVLQGRFSTILVFLLLVSPARKKLGPEM